MKKINLFISKMFADKNFQAEAASDIQKLALVAFGAGLLGLSSRSNSAISIFEALQLIGIGLSAWFSGSVIGIRSRTKKESEEEKL